MAILTRRQSEDIDRLVEAKRRLQNDVFSHLPEPPSGVSHMEFLCPFNPPGNRGDLEFVLRSVSRRFEAMRVEGWSMLTGLQQVLMPDLSVAYFWFHAVPPRTLH